ncbi:GNAT family N-acetyltransferase [Flavobacterium granuli]|uniref:Acetyltransferase (GNAT) domain-containing protein n=1 Tax=Flavobacterium granuli TaxID=280093 RepID=A0A1M5MX30_9FLAO|nr:GNAT family N-acetyltransferase [Flavobacterium granuli]PRZ25115.1 acetyltransferase (GNAT) family protein [Flavobacterium granuli]SHG81900.1 Acetyltransferase (GNAT) domain-containing protein [Flavobacterium granuli]
MAILENHQKKGFGEALILHCEKDCISKKVLLIWFNARTQAVGFYEKLAYTKKGNPFEIENIGEHLVMFKKLI